MDISKFVGVFGLLLVSIGSLAAESKQGTWVAIVPPAHEEAVTPLAREREAEGWKIRIQRRDELGEGEALPGKIRDFLQALVENETVAKPIVAVLVGVPLAADGEDTSAVVPAIKGDFLRMKGVAADSMYSLKDGKRIPNLSVGRLPAQNPEELSAMIAKIRKFESAGDAPRWKTRLSVVAASSGGGMFADAFVAQQMNVRLKAVPPRWTMTQVADLVGSLFRVPVKDLNAETKSILEQGQLFSCYLGHSMPAAVTSNGNHFFKREDFSALTIETGTGVFLTCGCETLAHGIPGKDGHGYAAMRSPSGPAAFIGAEGISWAAIGLLAFDGLIEILEDAPKAELTLAECWQSIYAGIETGEINSTIFTLMDQNDGTSGSVPLASQRKEHLQMWMVLGDPAMRIPWIQETIKLTSAVPEVAPGSTLTISGQLPEGWTKTSVRLSLERTMDSKPTSNAKNLPNQFVLAEATVSSDSGSFKIELETPKNLPWEKVLVRALAGLKGKAALGVIELTVAQPKPDTQPAK